MTDLPDFNKNLALRALHQCLQKRFKKQCCKTYKNICHRTLSEIPLQQKPNTIFFTLEIVPIGNSIKRDYVSSPFLFYITIKQ